MKTTIISNLFVPCKILCIILACQFTFFLTGCSPDDLRGNDGAILFKNVTVIDAVNGFRSDKSVLVRGNKIVEVARVDDIREPADAIVVNSEGKYLIPGLWDAHLHLTNTEALRPVMFPLLIVNGITYVRDTAATFDSILPLRDKAEEASQTEGMAPRVFMAGPHIDGLRLSWGSSVSAVTIEQARFIVDCLINTGVDEVKIYDMISPEVALEVISYVTEQGYNMTAHVPFRLDVVEASNAGLRNMEHMKNLELSCSSDWETLLQERKQMIEAGADKDPRELRNDIHQAQRLHAIQTQDEERCEVVLNTLAENNTWQTPTLTFVARAEHQLYAQDDFKETYRYLPESVRSDWEQRAMELEKRTPSEMELAYAHWAYDMIPRLAETGVGIMAGTDMPLFLLTPGFSLHKELTLLVYAGLTPMQALEAATLSPAKYFGLENQQGSISEGMLADLVILDANPLDDITNTQRIHAVMRDGHLHTREKLDEILDQLENPR